MKVKENSLFLGIQVELLNRWATSMGLAVSHQGTSDEGDEVLYIDVGGEEPVAANLTEVYYFLSGFEAAKAGKGQS